MQTESPALGPGDAVIVVDVQRDFCPGGALAVPEGDRVVARLSRWAERAARAGAVVVASRDDHPRGHVSFASRGGPWPEHCVQGTPGAELHPDLSLPQETIHIAKGRDPDRDQYSAFDGTGLGALLRDRGIRRVFVGGLAEDVCVRATVLDAIREGFEARVLASATRPVTPEGGDRAREEMQRAGAFLEQSEPPP